MGDLRDPSREKEALWALSEMTLDALRHATPALDYLCLLKCQSVFNFVAIPAVMAIATLERCFMNPDVLKKNVKIRKGEAIKVRCWGEGSGAPWITKGKLTVVGGVTEQLMRLAVNPRDVAYCFLKYARLIHGKTSVHDPNFVKLSIACGKVRPRNVTTFPLRAHKWR
jgi:farnesyl-diphosphate farnesyltransferase